MTLREPPGGAEDTTAEQSGVEQFRARARRAPKVGVFLGLGALVGALVALILVLTAYVSEDNGLWVFVVFFFGIGIGVAVGGVVALVLDRLSRRSASLVTVERGVVEAAEPADGDAAEPAAADADGPVNGAAAPASEITEN